MKDRTYNLQELRREAGVTERTVRYYIKEGLLPPPHGSGPFSRYGYEHWLRLQFIKRLKDEYLPLSEIKNLLESRSTGELDQLARQAGIIPSGSISPSGNSPKGQPDAGAQTSESLQNLIGGGSDRARLLREQMAPSVWSAPPVASNSFAAMPQPNNEFYEAAPEQSFSTYAAASDLDIDAFADVPGTYNLTFAPPASSEAAKDADLLDEVVEEEKEEINAPLPPLYDAPAQAKRAFSAQSFRAGAAPSGAAGAASGGGPAGPPASSSSGNSPLGGLNSNIPVPASPLRAMKMSRFAAKEVSSDFAGDTTGDNPGDFEPGAVNASRMASSVPVPPVPAPAPMMVRMVPASAAAPAPPPVSQPESAPEIVTGQTWERIEVAPGVELHIEKRIADTYRPALANLLQAARRLFGLKEI